MSCAPAQFNLGFSEGDWHNGRVTTCELRHRIRKCWPISRYRLTGSFSVVYRGRLNSGEISMPRRLIDISVPLKAGIKSDPPHMLPQIEYLDHHQTAPAMAEYMGVRVDQLPDGEYAAVEKVQISTHNGTHLDAPYHFFSTMNHALIPGGAPSWRIDEVTLEWCFQPGGKLYFR